MPSINLRLTDQEHAELTAWAQDGHRSLQKEIIWRLFTAEGHQAPKIRPATSEPRVGIEHPADGTLSPPISADAQPRDIPTRTITPSQVAGCGAYAPRGTKCKACGKVHS